MGRNPPHVNLPSQRGIRREDARTEGYDSNDDRFIATHEAGHAVSAVVLGIGLESVDIRRRRLTGDVSLEFTKTSPLHHTDITGNGEEGVIPHEVQWLTQPLAEAAVNPLAMCTDGDHHDVESARRIVAVELCRADDDDGDMTFIPEEVHRNAERLAKLVFAAYEDAGRLVREHREAIAGGSDLFLERKTLTGKEVARIVIGIGAQIF